MTLPLKKCAPVPPVSQKQLVLSGFETSFERKLNQTNHWIVLAHLIS
jgi:hypothetical protein